MNPGICRHREDPAALDEIMGLLGWIAARAPELKPATDQTLEFLPLGSGITAGLIGSLRRGEIARGNLTGVGGFGCATIGTVEACWVQPGPPASVAMARAPPCCSWKKAISCSSETACSCRLAPAAPPRRAAFCWVVWSIWLTA